MNSGSASFFRQLRVLILRNTEILLNSTGRLILMLTLPVVCSLIVAMVAGDDMFSSFQDSQTGFFVLCCAVVFTGVFNSIQDICKERSIIKREYCANLQLGAYICSKLLVQAVICAVQSLTFMVIFSFFADFGKSSDGIFLPAFFECFITVFLLDLSSDAAGLFISSLVRSSDTANVIAPVFLVLQVVFSGVLFTMNDFLEVISYFMVGRWAVGGLGSSADIASELRQARDAARSLGENISAREADIIEMYAPSLRSLLTSWAMLLLFTAIFSVFCALVLRRVSRDSR